MRNARTTFPYALATCAVVVALAPCAEAESSPSTTKDTAIASSSLASSSSSSATSVTADLSFNLQPSDTRYDGLRIKEKPIENADAASPFSFSLTYYFYSDYIFRGINFSEYGTEGRERLNHQMTTGVSVDLAALLGDKPGAYGTFSFGTFFEWFAGQKSLDSKYGGQNLQEVDYLLAWSYDIESVATTVSLGFTFYAFPNASLADTQEWSVALSHNDAWMWKWLWPDNEEGVFSPSLFYAQDIGITSGGSWIEVGFSHEFALSADFTLTPGVTLATDLRYLDPLIGTGSEGSTRLAYVQYGLTATYDMTHLLRLPAKFGSLELAGFLYFNDAVGSAARNETIRDEFFGGVSLGWSF